jgi:hypothetical protein
MCRCTGRQSWRRGDRRTDWAWVKQRLGRCYGALNGCLSWQLQRLFKIKRQNEDGAFVEYWLALALPTIPEDWGNLDPRSKFLLVRIAPAALTLHLFSVGIIVGCTQVFPEIATCCKTGEAWNKGWICSSHIDPATWNDVYDEKGENCILCTHSSNARRDFRNITHCITIPMQARTK